MKTIELRHYKLRIARLGQISAYAHAARESAINAKRINETTEAGLAIQDYLDAAAHLLNQCVSIAEDEIRNCTTTNNPNNEGDKT